MKDPKQMWQEILDGYEISGREDRENIDAFLNFNNTALKPGALDTKTKHIICSAIALATNSEYCIVGRIHYALEAGATRQELIEASACARLMGGSLVLGNNMTLFYETINAFAPEFGQ